MAHHPTGDTVEIVGIEAADRGRSCEEHSVCGSALQEDSVVRFRKVQIVVNEKEESAIAAIWVSDGVDQCQVGFLPRHHVQHWRKYEGVLAQVTEIYKQDTDSPAKRRKRFKNKGCAVAAIISSPPVPTTLATAGSTTESSRRVLESPSTQPQSPRKRQRLSATSEE